MRLSQPSPRHQTEVRQPHRAVAAQQDVPRLDVPMHEAASVGREEAAQGTLEDVADLRLG
jgi:hypothetical protein